MIINLNSIMNTATKLSFIQGFIMYFSGFVFLKSAISDSFYETFLVSNKNLLASATISITCMSILIFNHIRQKNKKTKTEKMLPSHIISIILNIAYILFFKINQNNHDITIDNSIRNVFYVLAITLTCSLLIATLFVTKLLKNRKIQ